MFPRIISIQSWLTIDYPFEWCFSATFDSTRIHNNKNNKMYEAKWNTLKVVLSRTHFLREFQIIVAKCRWKQWDFCDSDDSLKEWNAIRLLNCLECHTPTARLKGFSSPFTQVCGRRRQQRKEVCVCVVCGLHSPLCSQSGVLFCRRQTMRSPAYIMHLGWILDLAHITCSSPVLMSEIFRPTLGPTVHPLCKLRNDVCVVRGCKTVVCKVLPVVDCPLEDRKFRFVNYRVRAHRNFGCHFWVI